MALDARSMNPGTTDHRRPVVVELSDRRLPLSMRMESLRTAAGLPRTGTLRRVLGNPVAMLLRVISR